MTRPTKRRLARAIEDLEGSESPDRLELWRRFIRGDLEGWPPEQAPDGDEA